MAPRRPAALRDDDRSLREHLIATAERMIADDATGLTVRAIARAAGVADGVLYNHFADKEELLSLALRAHVDTVSASMAELPLPGTGSLAANLLAHLEHGLALHRAILPAFTAFLGQPAVLARFPGPDQGGDWRGSLLAYLRGERDLGRLDPTADVEAAAALIVGLCHESVLSTMFPHAAGPPVASEAVITAILRGIA